MNVPMKWPIDLHKGMTGLLVLGLMVGFGNWTLGPWVYLALHGSYGVMWVLKSWTFPDPLWEQPVPWWKALGVYAALALYWIAPLVLIWSEATPPAWLVCLSVTLVVIGTFLHFGSDAQKYFVLKARRGLITDGFFSRTRNPNYLGEMLIYGGFAALSMHWLPWIVCALYWGGLFVPNMIRKERSMARYPEWAWYTARSGLLLPKLWRGDALEKPTEALPSSPPPA